MLAGHHLNKEIDKLEKIVERNDKEEKPILKAVLKGICLLSKLVRDIRSNQVLIMKHEGIKLIEPEDKKTKPENK